MNTTAVSRLMAATAATLLAAGVTVLTAPTASASTIAVTVGTPNPQCPSVGFTADSGDTIADALVDTNAELLVACPGTVALGLTKNGSNLTADTIGSLSGGGDDVEFEATLAL